MGGDGRHALAEVVVGLELRGPRGLVFHGLDDEHAFLLERLAHAGADLRALRDRLGDDVPRTRERGLRVGDVLRRVHERRGLRERIPRVGLREDALRERLEAALPRDHGARAALGLEGQVQVLERGLDPAPLDLRAQRGRQLSLAIDLREDRGAALVKLGVVAVLLFDGSDLHLVELSGLFLTVARDEGDAGAFGEQLGDGAHAGHRERELLGDAGGGIEGGGRGGLRRERSGHRGMSLSSTRAALGA